MEANFGTTENRWLQWSCTAKSSRASKEVWYCADENKPIDRSDILKGYQTAKGEYVVVDDEELKKIAPSTATTMDIVQFVHNDEVDPIYFESSYYVGAEENAVKPYQRFLQALTLTKHHAIAKLSMHGREHLVLIRPAEGAMVLHTLFYPNEVHKANRAAPKSAAKLSPRKSNSRRAWSNISRRRLGPRNSTMGTVSN